jgi:hypothetical protein
MTDKHDKNELAVFGLFAPVCGLPIDFDSIEKRQPKEPDILCNVSGEGPVAFEMVRMVDQNRIAKPEADAKKLVEQLEHTHRNLPDETRAEFDRRFGNSSVEVRLRPSISLRRREKIAAGIIDCMMKLDPGFEGTLPVTERNLEVASVKVRRRRGTSRTLFIIPIGSFYSPVPLGGIKEKFNKKYKTSAPMELLAYYDEQQSAPLEEQLRELSGYIKRSLSNSRFRRAWVFNVSDQRVCFSVANEG